MEALVILLFIIIIVLILSLRNKTIERISDLEKDIQRLGQKMDLLDTRDYSAPGGRPGADAAKTPAMPDAGVRAAAISKPPDPPIVPPVEQEPFKIPARSKPLLYKDPLLYQAPASQAPPPVPPPPPPVTPGFFERHPDLEKFIGENLVSKIGIAILVLAIGFFVKYAIDNDWVGSAGRVGIGILCGGILVAVAHLLRNSYKAFSSVLVGGGLAVFYFTITLAYQQYHLFGQTASFIIMLVITVFAVILSLLYDRQELAIIALVGGFASPFMVSSGSGDYKILFSYLLILNTGLLAIAYNKAWRLLNILAFIFTALLFASWLFMLPDAGNRDEFLGGFLFATAFFILFLAINIANNIKDNKNFIASDFGILLANTCLYFAAGLYLLARLKWNKYFGLFSASMAVFNLGISYILFRKKKVDNNILYLLIGITLSFISLTAPIQLHGHYITLFWASESVLLYWLFQRSGIRIILLASRLVWGAMLISLFIDWTNVYGNVFYDLPVVFNKGLMTAVYAALCCAALFFLRRREVKRLNAAGGIALYADILIGGLLLFAGGALEIHHQFSFHYPGTNLFLLYLLLYEYLLTCLVVYSARKWHWFSAHSYTGWLMVISIIFYLTVTPDVFMIQRQLLQTGHYGEHFIAHWAGDGLVIWILYHLIAWIRKVNTENNPVFAWILCGTVVIFLSSETLLLMNALFFSKTNSLEEIQLVYIKAGLPILWSLCSFSFMWLGMRNKFKPLRIISLVLFSVTISKLFLFDISNIPIAGKIAAFFCLGVLLLIVSFMYQRLKKIIIEDEQKKNDQA